MMHLLSVTNTVHCNCVQDHRPLHEWLVQRSRFCYNYCHSHVKNFNSLLQEKIQVKNVPLSSNSQQLLKVKKNPTKQKTKTENKINHPKLNKSPS